MEMHFSLLVSVFTGPTFPFWDSNSFYAWQNACFKRATLLLFDRRRFTSWAHHSSLDMLNSGIGVLNSLFSTSFWIHSTISLILQLPGAVRVACCPRPSPKWRDGICGIGIWWDIGEFNPAGENHQGLAQDFGAKLLALVCFKWIDHAPSSGYK